jgi:hypothetical protein
MLRLKELVKNVLSFPFIFSLTKAYQFFIELQGRQIAPIGQRGTKVSFRTFLFILKLAPLLAIQIVVTNKGDLMDKNVNDGFKKKDLADKVGGLVEKAGKKISDMGAQKLGQKIHDLGDKLEDHHTDPIHPKKV